MQPQSIHHGLALAAGVLLLSAGSVSAEDAIDRLLQHGQVPADMRQQHGYSDFTDPLGRFLDMLAAGAFGEARALQAEACKSWLSTRQTSAFSGKVWVWGAEIDLDALCRPG